MRDLFRFLFRVRNTLLFLGLLIVSLVVLYSGNIHHRGRAINSSNAMVGTIFTWRKEITDYANLKEVNRRLSEENVDWRNRSSTSYAPVEDLFVRINDTIHRQLFRQISAKVVNSTWHKPRNFLTLDKGSTNGLHDGMGVIGPSGVIGVVNAVSPHFATVVSVLNPDVKYSVQLRRTGHFGLLYWDTNDPLMSSMIDVPKHARVQPGDTVETRSADGIFPAGVMVGTVELVTDEPGSNFHTIVVRLSEDMTRNGYVYAVDDLQKMERDTLEQVNANKP